LETALAVIAEGRIPREIAACSVARRLLSIQHGVAEVEPFDAPDIGKSLRMKAGDASGSALVFEDTIVHLEVFAPTVL